MKCALIVAMAENQTIGINNTLPWHLPNDLKYFKQVTMAKPIIMGRKTYESIGRPLPGRTNIVITRQSDYQAEGIVIVNSLPQALAKAEEISLVAGHEEVMVIGGAEIYQQALLQADRLYITHVHAEIEGDAFFPTVEWNDWQEVKREDYSADPEGGEKRNPFDYSFVVYDRTE
ncbi:Dihydrofolate reductase [Oleispira antarctica RB-8]|uniref:Dihydrofolate reductase n=1 Tax=Oleispira antarctica RB-8 TaxID=698738 RepID=R4YQB1_OLEAN|nr:Dihydrofolate reductase [Oleispira antarctica RB-8]